MMRTFFIIGMLISLHWVYQLYQSNESHKVEISQLENTLSLKERTLALRLKQRDRYRKTASQYYSELKTVTARIEHLQHQLTSQKAELGKREEAFDHLYKQQGDSATQLATLKADAVRLRREHDVLIGRIFKAHQLLAEADLDYLQAKQKVEQYALEQQQAQKVLARLEGDKHRLEEDNKEKAQQLKQQSEALAHINNENIELDAARIQAEKALQATLEKLKKANHKLALSDNPLDAATLLKERETLIKTNQQLVMQLSHLKEERVALKDMNSSLERRLLALSHELRQSKIASSASR